MSKISGDRLIKLFKNFWSKYMYDSGEKSELPEFLPDEERRYQIIFSGIVQGVGFRYETWRMAEKLRLTGFAENLPNGDVRVEVQGAKNRILYLIEHMKSIHRIHIENVEIDELELREEQEFVPVY